MESILQLKQEQLKLSFSYFRELVLLEERDRVIITDHNNRYLIVPTDLVIRITGEGDILYNTLLQMAKVAGYTYLMLIYN